MKREIQVTFKVWVGEPCETPLTEQFVKNRIDELGNNILEAFDETIHDVTIVETH